MVFMAIRLLNQTKKRILVKSSILNMCTFEEYILNTLWHQNDIILPENLEPPDEAMTRNIFGDGDSISAYEFLLATGTFIMIILSKFVSWPGLHTACTIFLFTQVAVTLFNSLIPPKLSILRLQFLIGFFAHFNWLAK